MFSYRGVVLPYRGVVHEKHGRARGRGRVRFRARTRRVRVRFRKRRVRFRARAKGSFFKLLIPFFLSV